VRTATQNGIKYGPDVLPAFVATWIFRCRPIQAAIERIVRDRDTAIRCATAKGGPAGRQVFAERMKSRYGWELSPDPGAADGGSGAGHLRIGFWLSRPGDGVVLQNPELSAIPRCHHSVERRLLRCRCATMARATS